MSFDVIFHADFKYELLLRDWPWMNERKIVKITENAMFGAFGSKGHMFEWMIIEQCELRRSID